MSNGKVEKRWLKDVTEAEYMTFRNAINKIPALLMNETQKRAFGILEQKNQLEFDGIQTTNFDMCPKAYAAFSSMIETIRAGKHIGELAGHQTNAVTTQNTDVIKKVQAGIALKPDRMRQMQFKQYTGL